MDSDWARLLRVAAEEAARYLDTIEERPVGRPVASEDLRARVATELQDEALAPDLVLDELVKSVDPGLVASAGPRYFGYVVGGVVPAALAADWMTSAWDQMAGSYVGSPAGALVEETAARWVVDLLGLPSGCSVGFTTGTQMSTFTALSAARAKLLAREGFDVERSGLRQSPPLRVVTGIERHVTVDVALRYLGIGVEECELIECDGQGAMRADALQRALEGHTEPTIVIAQAGNVNTGAFDPFEEIAEICGAENVWCHVDGAFGLWGRLDPRCEPRLRGVERADSWATDAHKWLNVPYDCGIVIMADAEAHQRAMRKDAAYAMSGGDGQRDNEAFVPEFSRRARAISVYAALRSLGRAGTADLIQRCNAYARRFAERVATHPRIEVANDVVLNQVLLRFSSTVDDERAVVSRLLTDIHEDGTFWAGRTEWQGRPGLRVSFSSWRTSAPDVDRAADTLLRLAPQS